MGAVYFYHLTQSPLAEALPKLIGAAQNAGWRVAVRTSDTAQTGAIDQMLWDGSHTGFLPHGVTGGPHDGLQPVLIGDGVGLTANTAQCLMVLGGADLAPAEVRDAERACIIFDGRDETAVARARVQWKDLVDAGCPAQYWAQEGGKWIKKAEK